jgi:hypothetical protein
MQALVRAGAVHAVVGASERRINGPRRILQDTDRRHTMARSNDKVVARRVATDRDTVAGRKAKFGITGIRGKVDAILGKSVQDIVGASYVSPFVDGITNDEQAAHVNHEEHAEMEANAAEIEGADGTGATTEEDVAQNNNADTDAAVADGGSGGGGRNRECDGGGGSSSSSSAVVVMKCFFSRLLAQRKGNEMLCLVNINKKKES